MRHIISVKYLYHIRKPRKFTENTQSLIEYRKNLRQARRQVHEQAIEYQNMIEDQYLARHSENMRMKHFKDQCEFRAKISKEAFKLRKDMEQWKKDDERLQSKVNKHIHNEDLKRINRERIKKIMSYESENFWFEGEEIEEKLREEVVFPSYVASTEYYHRLHAEAIVYEGYDFKTLHRIRSNEDVIKEKNRLLIPIFNIIKHKIKAFKTDRARLMAYQHQIATDNIRLLKNLEDEERHRMLREQQEQFEQQLHRYREQLRDPEHKAAIVKEKLTVLLDILGHWKHYTNVLGMTSVQMMKDIQEANAEGEVSRFKKKIAHEIRSVKNTTYVDAVEEDTEDVQVDLSDYLQQLRSLKAHTEGDFDETMSIHHSELEALMKEAETSVGEDPQSGPQSRKPASSLKLGDLVEGLEGGDLPQLQSIDIPESYLNIKETTWSVEVLKDVYKNNRKVTSLLNRIGELPVDYPRLFKKIWDTTRPTA